MIVTGLDVDVGLLGRVVVTGLAGYVTYGLAQLGIIWLEYQRHLKRYEERMK